MNWHTALSVPCQDVLGSASAPFGLNLCDHEYHHISVFPSVVFQGLALRVQLTREDHGRVHFLGGGPRWLACSSVAEGLPGLVLRVGLLQQVHGLGP